MTYGNLVIIWEPCDIDMLLSQDEIYCREVKGKTKSMFGSYGINRVNKK